MKNTIYPCLWFDKNAKEGAEFYCEVYNSFVITSENPMVVTIESGGQKFMCLNGGPEFKINPSISFFVNCDTVEEIDKTWQTLMVGGIELMPLDEYEWSKKYGWVQDRFGVNWQLSFGPIEELSQKFTPVLMFTDQQHGNAEPAIHFYTSIFKDSYLKNIHRYTNVDDDVEGTVKHAQFHLGSQLFMAMDSSMAHKFSFNEAVSFVVECETQDEIDFYWDAFTREGEESKCGWLKDKYGVSWQIVPAVLSSLMSDPSRSERVVEAFMQMNKFDIEKLLNA